MRTRIFLFSSTLLTCFCSFSMNQEIFKEDFPENKSNGMDETTETFPLIETNENLGYGQRLGKFFDSILCPGKSGPFYSCYKKNDLCINASLCVGFPAILVSFIFCQPGILKLVHSRVPQIGGRGKLELACDIVKEVTRRNFTEYPDIMKNAKFALEKYC